MLTKFWGTVVQSEATHLYVHAIRAISPSFFGCSKEPSLLTFGSLVSL